MGRGVKLDLNIGASFDEGWQLSEEKPAEAEKELLAPKQHRLAVNKEKRRGKTVTVVGPFFLRHEEALSLLKRLKKKLGCGGTFKTDRMEFQGDIKIKLHPLLVQEGFSLKGW